MGKYIGRIYSEMFHLFLKGEMYLSLICGPWWLMKHDATWLFSMMTSLFNIPSLDWIFMDLGLTISKWYLKLLWSYGGLEACKRFKSRLLNFCKGLMMYEVDPVNCQPMCLSVLCQNWNWGKTSRLRLFSDFKLSLK